MPLRFVRGQKLRRPEPVQQLAVQPFVIAIEKFCKRILMVRSHQSDPRQRDGFVVKSADPVALREALNRRPRNVFRVVQRPLMHEQPRKTEMVPVAELREA